MQELDRHLVREGRHEQLWTVLGANVRTYPGELGEVSGTSFAVWAPNARAVRVVGDFNYWQGASHAMRSLGDSGVWEVFAPGVGAGARYKFEVLGHGRLVAAEGRPARAGHRGAARDGLRRRRVALPVDRRRVARRAHAPATRTPPP